jgi:hypothetical protein
MTDVFGRLGYGDIAETQGRRPSDDRGGGGSDSAISQGVPRIARSHQKLRRGEEELAPRP